MTKQHRNVIDMTGKRIGKLTVLCRCDNDKHGQALWHCRCDCRAGCGNFIQVRGSSLRKGIPNSCGCDIKRPLQDVEGLRFGKWTVQYRSFIRKGFVMCWCDCGRIREVNLGNLKSGMSKSCGCGRRDCK